MPHLNAHQLERQTLLTTLGIRVLEASPFFVYKPKMYSKEPWQSGKVQTDSTL